MPTDAEVQDAIDEGMKAFNDCCELDHQVSYNWMMPSDDNIASLMGDLVDAAIKLSIMQAQGIEDQRVAQTIMLCKNKTKTLVKIALLAERRRGQDRYPFQSLLRR